MYNLNRIQLLLKHNLITINEKKCLKYKNVVKITISLITHKADFAPFA